MADLEIEEPRLRGAKPWYGRGVERMSWSWNINPMAIKGVDSQTLMAANLGRVETFYRGFLELPVVQRRSPPSPFEILQASRGAVTRLDPLA